MHKINIIFEGQINGRMTAYDSILYDSTNYTTLDSTDQTATTVDVKPVGTNQLKSVEKVSFIPDWAVIVITLMLLLLAWIRISSEKYFYSLFQSTFNYQTANRLFRERAVNIMHPSLRLDVLFLLVSGVFILHAELYLFKSLPYPDYIFLIINIGAILLYVNGKYFLYHLTGFLFRRENETNEFTFYLKSGNRIMGVFLLPIVVLLFFTSGKLHLFLLIFGLVIVLLFSVIGLFRGVRIIARKDFSISYLILYLCTLEILPLLIVWRILW